MGGITDKVIHLTTINHIKKMPREERVSNRCKKNIDDECHFFLHCQSKFK